MSNEAKPTAEAAPVPGYISISTSAGEVTLLVARIHRVEDTAEGSIVHLPGRMTIATDAPAIDVVDAMANASRALTAERRACFGHS